MARNALAPVRGMAAALLMGLGLMACDNGATTQIAVNGREIEVTGGTNHVVRTLPGGTVVEVDGLTIEIAADSITIGDRAPQALADWQRIAVRVDDGAATVTVDGEALE